MIVESMLTGMKQNGRKASAAKPESSPTVSPVEELLKALDAGEASVKLAASRRLRALSQAYPELLYPFFDRLANLLDGDNNFLRWDAMRTLANLASVDCERKLDSLLDRFLHPIAGPQMIWAANAITACGNIALAKPYLADRMASAVLEVQAAQYRTVECRHIAAGPAITALGRFIHLVANPKPYIDFASEQLTNPRPAMRKKAAKFLARMSSDSPRKRGHAV